MSIVKIIKQVGKTIIDLKDMIAGLRSIQNLVRKGSKVTPLNLVIVNLLYSQVR